VSKSGFVPDIARLGPDDWHVLRELRLSALLESPRAFLSTYDKEKSYGETEWRAELDHADWSIARVDGTPAGLVCVTREPDSQRSYIESLWVAPDYRGARLGYQILTAILDRLRVDGAATAFLWVLDGNAAAMSLYKRVGFESTNKRQDLEDYPGRSEEEMIFHLDS
jgi:ribosomal protein S18 acetylase RimI-like enzyme